MADDVTFQTSTLATPASGTIIETADQGGGVQRQVVQVEPGTDPVDVNVTNASVDVSGSVTATAAPVEVQSQDSSGLTTASTAYTSGDVLGTGWTFTSMAQTSGGGGRIIGAKMLDKGDMVAGVELWLSSGSITFGTDNAQPGVSDSDAEKLLGIIPLVCLDLGSSRAGTIGNLVVPYVCDATSLYVYAITRSDHSVFAAATDLRLMLFYERD